MNFWIRVGANYICFGLGLYALAAIASFILFVRRERPIAFPAWQDCLQACGCVAALTLLELGRQLWDSFEYGPFPLCIARVAIPMLYLLLGNAFFSISSTKLAPQPEPAAAVHAA